MKLGFKVIEHFNNYSINKEGIVINNKTKKQISIYVSSHGYKSVRLWKNNKSKLNYIHRILAQYFIPNILNKTQVNHIDGNRINNNLNNLEWVTPSENMKNASIRGVCKNIYQKGENHKYSILKEKDIIHIRLCHDNKTYTVKELSEKYKVGTRSIYHIVKRQQWKHI
jgi:hypothetical protein